MIITKALKHVCITTSMIMAASTVAFAADAGQATDSAVNVRKEANAGADVVGKIDKGSEYTVVGKSGDWYQISYEGENAFVSADYFELTKTDAVATGSSINVRKAPSASADSLGKLKEGQEVVVTGQSGDWYRIELDGETAYVSKDYISGDLLTKITSVASAATENAGQEIEDTYGVVTSSSGVKLRKEASMISIVLEVLPYGAEVNVDRVGQDWVRVVTDDGVKGYVSSEFLSVRKGERTTRSKDSSKGAEVVSFAKQYIGTPYVWGGTNLSKGVDCSGFVYAVMKNYGINLNRSSYSMVSNGVEVSKSDLQAGDLVFFNTGGNSGISHVGIYMGDGNYIHSTDGAAYGVTTTSLSSSYSANTYVTARRVIR
ncbi:SH3 domain-containing protein [Anaerotignum propionicum]|uniref:Murein DD-endopeptidase MepH n=2 Tax=root TaxID=1 RepID=A0A0X8V9U5_ANAPI|nr:SH3 domain-containing protein [Anaerotignum propionicum]AMJ41671.1 murein DD-endopeptidase MepH precursor [Anaerotignum propionicum DSM 1682]SHE88745.1 SH3 domain-containing protein [[Clostridium] propionicum DSM 1682] [Anaerotignum propionicum DSM 1682]